MDVTIGNKTVSRHAQAATGVFHGPVSFLVKEDVTG
jgi:hypothetical protein